MNRTTKAKWVWWVLVPFFPIVFHPWWLAALSVAVFSFLVWLLVRKKGISE
jgi:hypothetical protein